MGLSLWRPSSPPLRHTATETGFLSDRCNINQRVDLTTLLPRIGVNPNSDKPPPTMCSKATFTLFQGSLQHENSDWGENLASGKKVRGGGARE